MGVLLPTLFYDEELYSVRRLGTPPSMNYKRRKLSRNGMRHQFQSDDLKNKERKDIQSHAGGC